MVSFIISLLALLAGYFFYGKVVERVFGPDKNRPTPAVAHPDGVDYVPMPTWRVFMIQFLNIAGTIFGAIMGAKFGPSAYLWIVFGCIFAGAVHDYLSGMLSLRNDGCGLPVLIGRYLGNVTKNIMLVFSLLLLVLVGAVFVYSPAIILGSIFGSGGSLAILSWVVLIFFYYVIATMLPIDKIIGKIYPLFAVALIFMAIALMVGLFVKWPSIPELWDGLANKGPEVGLTGQPIFPCLFITIACGAVSGFHATQSPLMARCLKNEKLGRPIFYGSMITEGMVALIWAAVASYFFFDGGAAECGSDITASAPAVVTAVSKKWLGLLGGILAILGVVAAPITSGDTALRGARLIVADWLKLDQQPIRNRLRISVPLRADRPDAVVQHHQRKWLQHHLEILRLGQPDPGGIDALGHHGLSDHYEERVLVSHQPLAGLLHDCGQRHFHPGGQGRLQGQYGSCPVDRDLYFHHRRHTLRNLEKLLEEA